MPDYDSAWAFANAVTLTALLGVGSVVAWRRRGALSGLRWAGVALLPMAMYFLGLMRTFWLIARELSRFVTGLAWNPGVWLGLGLAVLAILLIVVPGRVRGAAAGGSAPADSTRRRTARPGRTEAGGTDDELAEIEAMLKRRGIN